MEAQVWTLIGLQVATLLGAFVYLGNKIDGLEARLGGRIDRLGGRIDGLDSRMDSLAARMDALVVRVEEQGRDLGDRIYQLAVKLDDHLRRHAI